MSKELEALNILKNRISTLALNHKIGNRDIANLEIKDIVTGIETWVIPIFEKALTPPTAEEVCMALSDYFGFSYYYQDNFFHRSDEIKHIYPLKVSGFTEIQLYDGHLPPHLITLIGRFYEGVTE